jgi:peptidoglycan-associated lipoprotein
MFRVRIPQIMAIVVALAVVTACSSNKGPVMPPTPFPGGGDSGTPPVPPPPVNRQPTTTEPVVPTPTAPAPVSGDPLNAMAIDDVNRSSVLKPVFFLYDSDQLDDAARTALSENSQMLKKYPLWVITVEGHCDERGSAEYNLALGDRRAQAARTYLVSLGVPADRLRTVSYGKEFPFDPGHDEDAWIKNRRAQFMMTAK